MRNTRLLSLSILLVIVGTAPGRGEDRRAAPPKVFLFDGGRIAEARRGIEKGDERRAEALRRLRARADEQLQTPPLTVVDKPWTPPSGDKRDYLSIAPYWWPDPSKPDGTPYIRKDGLTNPERARYDRPKIGRLCEAVPTLALAYALTDHEPYADRAALLLRAWFLDPKTRMNPHLNFGQFIRGINDGRAAGVIETRGLLQVVDAVGLLAGAPSWTERDTEGMRAWFRDYLAWLRQSPIGQDESRARNNHGTWYDAQVATFALFVGDERLAREVLGTAGERRIARQIEPDGRQPLELARTKAFGYSLMNLEGLVTLAILGDRFGVDLWRYRSPDGRSIRAALDWLIPYADGSKPWPYQQIAEFGAGRTIPLLRRAAIVYHEPGYERALERLISRAERPTDEMVLLMPPGPSE
jgi:hypothetical protein